MNVLNFSRRNSIKQLISSLTHSSDKSSLNTSITRLNRNISTHDDDNHEKNVKYTALTRDTTETDLTFGFEDISPSNVNKLIETLDLPDDRSTLRDDKDMPSPGVVYVVATPIGNLGDMSPRGASVLRHVDVICAEDTRHTIQLLRLLFGSNVSELYCIYISVQTMSPMDIIGSM